MKKSILMHVISCFTVCLAKVAIVAVTIILFSGMRGGVYASSESTPSQKLTPDLSVSVKGEPKPVRTPRVVSAPKRTPRVRPRSTPTPRAGYEVSGGNAGGDSLSGTAPDVTPIPVDGVERDYGLALSSDIYLSFTNDGQDNIFSVSAPVDSLGRMSVVDQADASRIILDIPLESTPDIGKLKTISVNNEVLKDIVFEGSPSAEVGVRVILNLRKNTRNEMTSEREKYFIRLINGMLSNVAYTNTSGRAYLSLYHTAITQGGEELTEFYTASQSVSGRKWTLSFDSTLDLLGTGVARVLSDELLRSVEIKKSGGKTSVIITTSKEIVPVVFTKTDPYSKIPVTTVSLIVPAKEGEQLVVIDAGHGGHDPGAVGASGEMEKDICLDIARRIKGELDGKAGVRVFLTRDDDNFVNLYERALIANALDADLFVSVHCNAIDGKPSLSGTETLYFPSKDESDGSDSLSGSSISGDAVDSRITRETFSSKVFAELTQKHLMERLNTIDRGLTERPNLVVLRRTKMPAILIETAFMTNSKDLKNLSTPEFRGNVAMAAADSVTVALTSLLA